MVIAHLLGGGEITINWFAPFVLIASGAIFFIKNPREFRGPSLAAVLLVFQVAGHFSFGMSHSDGRMSIAHVVALFISFHLIRHFEEIVFRVGNYFTQRIAFEQIDPPKSLVQIAFSVQRTDESQDVLRHFSGRAPPLRAAA